VNPEAWEKVERIYHAALQCPADERAAFLDQACAGDEGLRREVESLLAYDEPAQHFITKPLDVFAADLLAGSANSSLIGSRVSHYQILSLVGRGGMGEVFLAADTELGRKVALKLLPAHWTSDGERVRRFKQEARAASALNHPNILTVHEIGEFKGRHFIVSEFVEGETLRQRIKSGPIPSQAALEIATQVASALVAAHQAGIVHRDIKPENVMVRPDGLVKVLDFGLAKLAEPRQIDYSITEPGQVVGTPSYMSPEQARGAGVDARSDIFSLGLVLFEMIAGRPPFAGATATDLIISIVQAEPEPLRSHAPDAPPELEQIVARALRKKPQERYETAADLLSDLKRPQQRLNLQTKSAASSPVPPWRTWPWRKISVAAVIALLLVIGWLWLARPKPESSSASVIAVLPFKNLSAEPESEYFVDGLTDEIIRNLSLIEGLEVRSRTSSFTFKDKPHNIRDVGEQLKANLVLDGSVLRSAGNLRINAELVRVSDDTPLWSGRFDRELKDIFTIQDEISRSVVNELRLKLGRGKRRYDTNSETYELYLKGRSFLVRGGNPNATRSAELFEQVIGKDPAFAPAYAGLAEAYATLSSILVEGHVDAEAAYATMRATAERALQLDPLLADAHAAMGQVYARELDWAGAEKAFRRATDLNPNLTKAYVDLAYFVLAPTGRVDQALQELGKAGRADPLSPMVWQFRGMILISAGRFEEGIASCRRALAADPNSPGAVNTTLARGLFQKGRTAEAIAILEKDTKGGEGYLGYAYAVTGRRAEAEALAAKNAHAPRRQALIYAGLGDKERLFDALERMAADKDPLVQLYISYPELALIRDDPRLPPFRKKIGLQ
jgi:serine/threonine protein kinase/cytochrome c-type biogenesis protein CcmH/NrfG